VDHAVRGPGNRMPVQRAWIRGAALAQLWAAARSLPGPGARLTKSAIREREGRTWLTGSKTDVNPDIDSMAKEGLLASDGKLFWLP